MDKGYSAFGLALQSPFPLPGMKLTGSGALPRLDFSLETTAALDAAWSGAISPQPWRGRLGDGHELTIEWGRDGDLRFGYSGGAQFRLDPSRTRLACAPRGAATLEWQRFLLTRVLPNVSLALGREGLHAAAVETSRGVVAIAAPSGTGKSTLAVELIGRGARLFADDVLVLDRGRTGVHAHPGTPHINVADSAAAAFQRLRLGTILGSFPGERWGSARQVGSESRAVAAIALFQRAPGLSLAIETISPSPLILAPFMLGLPDEAPERSADRFALYSDLVETTTVLHLTAGIEDPPTAIADTIERALGLDRAPAKMLAAA